MPSIILAQFPDKHFERLEKIMQSVATVPMSRPVTVSTIFTVWLHP